MLKDFGFDQFQTELSTWDPNDRKNFVGSEEQWVNAIQSLENVLKRKNVDYKTIPGEAAFYGPKIDIKLVHAIGRLWQLSTVQVDFNLPQRFGLEYVAEDGSRKQPVMVHRALFGSIERFFGVLIEHYAGAFPVWLSPVQVAMISIRSATRITPTRSRSNSRPSVCAWAWTRATRRRSEDPRTRDAEGAVPAGGRR